MPIRETFSNSIAFAVISKYDRVAVVQLSTVFAHVYHLLVKGLAGAGLFRHLYNHVFGVHNFGNTKSMKVICFFKMFKI